MRRFVLVLLLGSGISALAPAIGAAQTPPDTIKQIKRPPSTGMKIAKGLADTAVTAAAGAALQSVLGKQSAGIANALGVGAGSLPCSGGSPVSGGAAIVGVAKGVAKKAIDSVPAPAQVPCPQAQQISGVIPAPSAAAAGAGSPAAGLGVLAGMTPAGLAIGVAPEAIKGVKALFGGKNQDKIAMLRELGKGALVLKDVRFIAGTAVLEPGYEGSLAALGEAIVLAEGTYLLYVAAETKGKGTAPDTALARKRMDVLWAGLLVNGVPDQRLIAATVLPKELEKGRKTPELGKSVVEILRLPTSP